MQVQACDVCKITVNSQDQLQIHLGGKGHAKKLKAAGLTKDGTPLPPEEVPTVSQEVGQKRKREVEGGTCELCHVVFNSRSQMEQHYSGSKHAKKLKITQGSQGQGEITSPNPTAKVVPNVQSGMLFCGFCNLQVNSMEQLDKHRAGSKHQKVLQSVQAAQTPSHKKNTTDPLGLSSETQTFVTDLEKSFTKPEQQELTLPPFESYLKG